MKHDRIVRADRPAALVDVLILGVDAGAPALFRKWIQSGDMPNLARLQEGAAWGTVTNPPALEAGAVWPVFHSALLPGHQPQYDGRRLFDPRDYSTRWYESGETPPTAWRQIADQGARCLLLDPPYLRLDTGLNGAMVVDWGGHVPADGQHFRLQTHPPELAEKILATVGPDPAEGVLCDDRAPESVEEYRAFIRRYQERIRRKAELTRMLLRQGPWDLMLASFMDLHCTGHHLWHINDKGHPRYDAAVERALGEPLRECYRLFDQGLGEILSDIDERSTVILFGSHGMGPQYTGTGLLDRILLSLDRGAPAPHARSIKARLRAVWHLVPIELRARLRVLRKPFSGALHPPRFLGNEAQRRFFEVYANNATGGVRLNLKGREASGIVEPSAAPALLAQLRQDLLAIVNTETGRPLAARVDITRDLYSGEHIDCLPDLLVSWNREAPIRWIHSDKTGTIAQESADCRTGDHTPDGGFMMRGPTIRAPGEITGVRAQDFGPTVAALLGRRLERTDGRVIAELVGDAALTRS